MDTINRLESHLRAAQAERYSMDERDQHLRRAQAIDARVVVADLWAEAYTHGGLQAFVVAHAATVRVGILIAECTYLDRALGDHYRRIERFI